MTFEVNKIVDLKHADADVSIDEDELTECFVRQPSLFAYYGVLFAKAERQMAEAKQNLDQVIAAVDKAIREAAAKSGEKVTEKLIDKQVDRNRAVSSAKKLVIDAREQESVAKAYVDAFRHRKDSLWSLGLHKRSEMEGELTVKRSQDRDESRQGAKDRMARRVKETANK